MKQRPQKRMSEGPENPPSHLSGVAHLSFVASAKKEAKTEASLRCKYCGCETNEDVVKAAYWTRRGLIVIEDIPAQLCKGCGEQFFDEKVTQKIAEVTKYPAAKAKQQVRVPIYSLLQDQAAEKQSIESAGVNGTRQNTFLCKYCKSQTVEDVVKSVFWPDGEPIIVENIPAKVCQRCGQQFYDDETAEKITALEKSRCEATMVSKSILAPVFSLMV